MKKWNKINIYNLKKYSNCIKKSFEFKCYNVILFKTRGMRKNPNKQGTLKWYTYIYLSEVTVQI